MNVETAVVSNAITSRETMTVRVGSVSLAFTVDLSQVDDARYFQRVKKCFRNYLTDEPADLSIELSGVKDIEPDELKGMIPNTTFSHQDNSFVTTTQIIEGKYDLPNHKVSISGERDLANPDLKINHLNRLLTIMYYSTCKVKYGGNPPAFLVHGCGIVRNGFSVLFAGPPDVGKSTVARLCGTQYGSVLNDEMVLVSSQPEQDDMLVMESTPMLGDFPVPVVSKAPLRCAFLLKQGREAVARELDRTEAFTKFMRQVISPAYLGQLNKREVFTQIAQFSDTVTSTTPFYELEFALDQKSLWRTVAEVENTLGERK